MIGQSVEMLLPERLPRKQIEEREKYMKEPKDRPMCFGLEIRGRRKDGSEIPVEISLSTLETSGGAFVIREKGLSLCHRETGRC